VTPYEGEDEMTKIAFQRAFQELNDDEIATLLEGARLLDYKADTRIMREGENQNRIFVILDGEVSVVRLGSDGEETELTSPLGPGDTVGEMSFIDELGASATLIARTPVKVKAIDKDLVEQLKNDNATFAERFYLSLLYTVIRRLRVLDYKMAYPS